MGVGPIPWSSIRAYAGDADIVGDYFSRFHRLLRALDDEYVKQANATDKKSAENFVSVSDVEGVHQLFGRVQARAASATKRHVKQGNGKSGRHTHADDQS